MLHDLGFIYHILVPVRNGPLVCGALYVQDIGNYEGCNWTASPVHQQLKYEFDQLYAGRDLSPHDVRHCVRP